MLLEMEEGSTTSPCSHEINFRDWHNGMGGLFPGSKQIFLFQKIYSTIANTGLNVLMY